MFWFFLGQDSCMSNELEECSAVNVVFARHAVFRADRTLPPPTQAYVAFSKVSNLCITRHNH